MAKRTGKRNPLVFAAARAIGGALAKKGAKTVAKKAVKSKAKSAAKKTASKPKASSQTTLEKRLRSENRGDARTKTRIDKLKKQEETGLISPRERQQALNKMTKYSKAKSASPKKKIGGIKRDTRTSKR